ncbi:hypothetical protein [Paracoccus jeotgali]|uniref:HTH DNA binding domain-containing protein n=1 Tax=Paracoccus jeotgali TaxID=2065379 RepID=A0A2K9MJN4_9RHOB|nr:hypothetical protein [Paracoccus jeotgali]AUM75840.1 hypothetical protein CYR75_15600 [Paracoccus jeotgali]
MKAQAPTSSVNFIFGLNEVEETSEADLWFLPGPTEGEPDLLPSGPGAQSRAAAVLDEWRKAEADHAARLAHVAGRLGALDDRLQRGPEGWRHYLALIEAAELSWFFGDRITPDRLALWTNLRLSGMQEDTAALTRAGWAVQRLSGSPGPEAGLAEFLGRHDPEHPDLETEPLADRADSWRDLMASLSNLHPISRACAGFHVWSLAGLTHQSESVEAAVTASRIAAGQGKGAVFAPLAMGGAGGLRGGGSPADRLSRWLDGMESAIFSAMRRLDDLEAWATRADTVMASLSGRTPPALRAALTDWPVLSAPMAEALIGASRAAVQRNLAWMEKHGLVQEITGQGRFRFWRAAV